MYTKPKKHGASILQRIFAKIIDWVWSGIVGFGFGLVLGIVIGIAAVSSGSPIDSFSFDENSSQVLNLVFGNIGFLLYNVICEWLFGATLGKWIMGIRVVSFDGRACSFKQALIRSLALFVDLLFFGLIAYSSMVKSLTNQRYGDRWAKTVVIKKFQVPIGAKRGFLVFLIALLFGSFLLGIFSLIPIFLQF
jgi:uncharacterized RDD family membrane protein YckC